MKRLFLTILVLISTITFAVAENDASTQPQIKLIAQLYNAATNGDLETAKKAVEAGADINGDFISITSLYQAASYGHTAFVEWAVNNGAKIEYKNGPSQRTALHQAVFKGHVETATKLIDLGANTNPTNTHGRTPLFYAYFHEGELREKLISLLLAHGANRIEPPSEATKAEIKSSIATANTLLRPQNSEVKQHALDNVDVNAILTNDAQKKADVAARQSISSSVGVDSNKYAEVLRLSKATGLPSDVVERNFEHVRKKETLDSLDINAILTNAPEAKAWLSDHNNTKLVSDDFSTIGRFKHALNMSNTPYVLSVALLLYLAWLFSKWQNNPIRTVYKKFWHKKIFRASAAIYSIYVSGILIYTGMEDTYINEGAVILLLILPPIVCAALYWLYQWYKRGV